MEAKPYIRTHGEHAGEAAVSLKSKLIHIGLIKIDGQQVYPLKPEPEAPALPVESLAGDAGDAGNGNDPLDDPELPDMAARTPVQDVTLAALL